MKIAVVGTGYVGLITGTVFAELGNDVTCIDIDCDKINKLSCGVPTIYEPGLEYMLKNNLDLGRLHFNTSLKSVLDNVDIVFSSVGTPPDEDGSADLKYVMEVAREFAENINGYKILVTKSTVPVGTADKLKKYIRDILDDRGLSLDFDVVSNPEFLKEGSAIDDCLHPDRIVIGTDSEKAKDIMRKLYSTYIASNYPVMFTDVHSAEMIKYASNSMLATRISFINEIANICEAVGANVEEVANGMGLDNRIGPKFLKAGCGYGGSCFPKDVKALIQTAKECGVETNVLIGVEETNKKQKGKLFRTLSEIYPNLAGKTIAIWGLSFKPNTDDMREAPSLVTISHLLENGCKDIRVYDPIAMNEAKRILGDKVVYCNDKYEAAENANAILILTEWDDFKKIDSDKLMEVVSIPLIIDGRNVLETPPSKFAYIPIGKPRKL